MCHNMVGLLQHYTVYFTIISQYAVTSPTHIDNTKTTKLSNSYTMGCPPVRGDNPRALASELPNVLVDKHGITILYHLH